VIAIFVSSFPQYGFQGAFSGSGSGGFSFDGILVSAPAVRNEVIIQSCKITSQ
jgi:hypothetical protein